MPSKPAERRAIGYKWAGEENIENYTLWSLLGHRCRLSNLDTFFYARPTYRVLALLIKRMLPVKRILFIKHIFSCCRVL